MAVIVDSNVNLATQVRDVLTSAGGSVGNDITSFFKSTANLNQWSKYKPVIHAQDFVDDSYRWKATDGNCGFTFPSTNTLSEIPAWYNDDGTVGMNSWVYNIPTGGSQQPMRLGDFRGYNTVAYPLTQGFYCPDKGSNATGESITCMCMMNDTSELGLAVSDIATLASCYFGVYAVNALDSTKYQRACATTVGGASVTMLTSGLSTGIWYVYPFFTTSTIHESGTKYYPVPNVSRRSLRIVTSLDTIQVQITGTIDATARTCSYQILAKNTGSTTTLSNNFVYMKYKGNDLSTSLVTGEKSQTVGSLSIPASTSFTQVYSGSFTNLDDNLIAEGRLWLTMSGGTRTDYVDPMKSPFGQT